MDFGVVDDSGERCVVFAGAAGVLAVPGAGWEAASLLAASSALAMSTVLMRLTGDHGIVTAFAAAAGAVSAAAGLGIAVGPRLDVTGVALAIISIAALSAAPRIAALAAGLPTDADADFSTAGVEAVKTGCWLNIADVNDFMVAQPWLKGVEQAHVVTNPNSLRLNALSVG